MGCEGIIKEMVEEYAIYGEAAFSVKEIKYTEAHLKECFPCRQHFMVVQEQEQARAAEGEELTVDLLDLRLLEEVVGGDLRKRRREFFSQGESSVCTEETELFNYCEESIYKDDILHPEKIFSIRQHISQCDHCWDVVGLLIEELEREKEGEILEFPEYLKQLRKIRGGAGR